MCQACVKKAEGIRRLARYFREKAGETQWADFIDLMTKTAEELDGLAESLPRDCANGEPEEAAGAGPAGPHQAPPIPNRRRRAGDRR